MSHASFWSILPLRCHESTRYPPTAVTLPLKTILAESSVLLFIIIKMSRLNDKMLHQPLPLHLPATANVDSGSWLIHCSGLNLPPLLPSTCSSWEVPLLVPQGTISLFPTLKFSSLIHRSTYSSCLTHGRVSEFTHGKWLNFFLVLKFWRRKEYMKNIY